MYSLAGNQGRVFRVGYVLLPPDPRQLTGQATMRTGQLVAGRSTTVKAGGCSLLTTWSRDRRLVARAVGAAALGVMVIAACTHAADPAGTSGGSSPLVTSGGFSSSRSSGADGSSSQGASSAPSSSGVSNYDCAASGASATRLFVPSSTAVNTAVDSTIAIQRTINAAASAGGGVVALPAGTFVIDGHLTLKNNVELTGVGPRTVLKAGPGFLDSTSSAGGYPIVTTAGASNVTIANLTADQSGNVLDGNAVPDGRLAAYLIDVRNSHNVLVEDVYTRNPFTYSIAVVGSNDFCVARCNTRVATSGRYNQLDGIHVLDSNTGQVIDNYVDQGPGTDGDDGLVAHTIGAPVYNILYANNTVRGGNNGDGMQLAVGNYPIYNVTIRDNDFYGSPFGVRAGYYGNSINGSLRDIVITGNYIHDLYRGNAFLGTGGAIYIGGFKAIGPVTYIKVTNNRTCRAGIIMVASGIGNTVTQNHSCSRGARINISPSGTEMARHLTALSVSLRLTTVCRVRAARKCAPRTRALADCGQ